MAINPEIRDQAYQFFIEEAPELLQEIEDGLLKLLSERSTAQIHNLMRAAHSLKGGAASIDLGAIATLAHRLENIFKALYNESVAIDVDFESQLFQAYDCLRLPLREQIESGQFDAEQALAIAEPIFIQIEDRLGDALSQADNFIPSSSELGVNMALSIFEVDVSQGLERLATVVANPGEYEVAGELRAQAEVFAGFGALLELPGFSAIADLAIAALDANPERAVEITQLALADFQAGREAVLGGDSTQGGSPSAGLSALSEPLGEMGEHGDTETQGHTDEEGIANPQFPIPDVLIPDATIPDSLILDPPIPDFPIPDFPLPIANLSESIDEELIAPEELSTTDEEIDEEIDEEVILGNIPSLDEIFGSVAQLDSVDSNAILSEQEEAEGLPFNIDSDFLIPITSTSDTLEQQDSEPVEVPEEPEIVVPQELETVVSQEPEIVVPQEPEIVVPQELETVVSQEPEIVVPQEPEIVVSQELETVVSQEPETVVSQEPEIVVSQEPEIVVPQELETVVLQEPEIVVSQELETVVPQEPETVIPKKPETVEVAVQSIEQLFEQLQAVQDISEVVSTSAAASKITAQQARITQSSLNQLAGNTADNQPKTNPPNKESAPVRLSVRVDSERLETMNNLAGELAINRNSLSLQNEQLQGSVQELLNRFVRFGKLVGNLRELSDQMLVDTSTSGSIASHADFSSAVNHQWLELQNNDDELPTADKEQLTIDTSHFDSLELDSYGTLHSRLQSVMEEMMQLEEAVNDIALFAGQSVQSLEQQQQMLSQLRDEVMWARMLPLSEVLNRFPRILRDLSNKYHKPVNLKLSGMGVLVDKGVLEKLYDPLLHLLRNAFDHGIESLESRRQLGKPEVGQIQLTAYHKGNSTIIEVTDDGQGIQAEAIRKRAIEREWFSLQQLERMNEANLLELIFEPGFTTTAQVTELSGRGVGLDVVRSQLRALKGSVAVTSSPNQGTTFTLKLPLTLTIAKLMVCLVGDHGIALPSDSIDEIVIPKTGQIKQSKTQRFLLWQQKLVPVYPVADLLEYRCPSPKNSPTNMLAAVPSPAHWALPLLVMTLGQETFALEVESLITEQELVIKPFGSLIVPPNYTYGCTILGDGSLIPVIDGAVLVEPHLGGSFRRVVSRKGADLSGARAKDSDDSDGIVNPTQPTSTTVLVVDDAVALRRTLALTLEKAGFRVLQAKDGREAIEQLQKSSPIGLVICDIEMPNMNGFDFLNYRRQDSQLMEIPVAMLTSRSNEKHRWLAMHLGATAYFTKPYIEQDFLTAIKDIISN